MTNCADDAPCCDPRILVFPNSHDSPASFPQSDVGVAIATPVVSQLGPPKRGIRLRCRGMKRAAVPEAAVHEDGNAFRTEGDVDLSPDAWYHGSVEAESQTQPMKLGAESALGLGVGPPRRDHSVASFFRRSGRDAGTTADSSGRRFRGHAWISLTARSYTNSYCPWPAIRSR